MNPTEPLRGQPPDAPSASVSRRKGLHAWLGNTRLCCTGVGGTLLALLVTAACLRPDPSGMGTHRQLGLPPCSLVLLTGVRCPACGMTTSWSHLMHGQIIESWKANPAGTYFALLAMVAIVIAAVLGYRNRPLSNRGQWTMAGAMIVGLVGSVIDWSIRLFG